MSKAIKQFSQVHGFSGPDTKEYGGPTNYSTPFSSVVNGRTSLDPSIRNLQDEGLNRTNAIYGDVGNATDRYIGNTQSLRDSLSGNAGAYMQARVNPVLQRFGTLRSQTQQDLGRRGLSGSSFQTQAMTNVDRDAATAEADARAQATMETIAAQSGLDTNMLSAAMQRATLQAGLNNENYQVASARLQQELASLGLDAGQINQAIQTWQANQQNYLTGFHLQSERMVAKSQEEKNRSEAFKNFSSSFGGGGGM